MRIEKEKPNIRNGKADAFYPESRQEQDPEPQPSLPGIAKLESSPPQPGV